MSITIDRAPDLLQPEIQTDEPHGRLRTVLLACGIAYGLLYVVANDVIAAAIYDGYSRMDQAISELSSTEAPSRAFLTAMLPIFTLLVIGFGIGVWKSSEGNRRLRTVGGILVAQGLMFPLWLLAPMTSRGEFVDETLGANDVGHFVLGAVAVLFILAEMWISATALRKRFRIFSLAMAATALASGIVTGVLSPDVVVGEPTPWMGFAERISYGTWVLWMAVLAVTLMRRKTTETEGGQR